jgi:hypothetical protein
MKQGTANSRSGDQKQEPVSKAVDVCAVADIGIQTAYTKPAPALYFGRGFSAPGTNDSTHPNGSQGKH